MPEAFRGWPIWALFAFFFFLAMARGQATYWLARYLTRAGLKNAEPTGWRGRMARWLDGSGVDHGAQVLRRWGLVAVPLCYLTVGLQSAIIAAAGVIRISALAFTLAQIPGALAWATIYSTIGWGLWQATFLAIAGSPWGLVMFLALTIAVVLLVRGHRRRSRRRSDDVGAEETPSTPDEHDDDRARTGRTPPA
ncbi:DedA family protein [Mobilicoccus caccae]|uniref:Membrane protein DedA, SNARE-associated domain n=1 Tax=Mobilicoccus caccae TaxID=1859295 RepID=A0ABQ6ISW0_9MICO|nr:hypothetical protein [Mobilicoccus caccae]GMA40455.1 hypothetical protein GCM10025883_25000 [Mobilicoccus caccae]